MEPFSRICKEETPEGDREGYLQMPPWFASSILFRIHICQAMTNVSEEEDNPARGVKMCAREGNHQKWKPETFSILQGSGKDCP